MTASSTAGTARTEEHASYRRNVPLLSFAQVLFMTVQSMGTVVLPLAALPMLEEKRWATVPLFLNHAGIMAMTIPASLIMAKIGRRWGFTIGACLSLSFGALGALAVLQQSFLLLCVSAFLKGSAAAFAHYYRFAAADAPAQGFRSRDVDLVFCAIAVGLLLLSWYEMSWVLAVVSALMLAVNLYFSFAHAKDGELAPAVFKPRAISYVMAGGVAAGFIGPELAKVTVDWIPLVPFMGVFVGLALVAAVSLIPMQFLNLPNLTATEMAKGGRPLSEIAKQPAFITAVISSMFGYATMTLVMTSTPLAMNFCGYGFRDNATVIQWHIVAMFLPSFFTGHLIQRFGVLPIIVTGALIEAGCAIVNLAGVDFWNFLFANVLVGLGWNFCFVGGTTLLTRTYEPVERAKVQAAHDFTVYFTTATAALLSGFMQASLGWTVINIATLPLMLSIVLAVMWLAAKQRAGAVKPVGA